MKLEVGVTYLLLNERYAETRAGVHVVAFACLTIKHTAVDS